MQGERAYKAETIKLVEYVESKEHPLIQVVRTHQHNTNSTLFQTVNKFKKYFQSKTKHIKNIIAQNLKKVGRKKDAWTIPM
jgi:alpha-D-ribose 1-methylphosphonate 5-triphosphate diphosphatase PhnM